MGQTTPEQKLGDIAAAAGIRRIHVLAWRDLADVEAGGSELHAAEIMKRWAAAGLEITTRTSYAQGAPPETVRDGYRVIRRAGRYMVFPRAVVSEIAGRHGPSDAVVEVWNGVPFFTPVWAHKPRLVILHHHHEHMWHLNLPDKLAAFGTNLETRIAPPLYRRSQIVTLSESSKSGLVKGMGLPAENIRVVPPGIDERFSPGGSPSEHPLIVAVGRLMSSKRFDALIETVDAVRRDVPNVELIIVGEGYERDALKRQIAELDASSWVRLAGRVSDEDLIALYRRAWVVASASVSEGWGMTLTEAAACGTPAVATRIPGHADAVVDDRTGLLADGETEFRAHLRALLTDTGLRRRLSDGALEHAAAFTWDATALGAMQALAAQAATPRRR